MSTFTEKVEEKLHGHKKEEPAPTQPTDQPSYAGGGVPPGGVPGEATGAPVGQAQAQPQPHEGLVDKVKHKVKGAGKPKGEGGSSSSSSESDGEGGRRKKKTGIL